MANNGVQLMTNLCACLLLSLTSCVTAPIVSVASGWRSEARSFQNCMSNYDANRFVGCREHDYDHDGDVDMKDFAFWASLDPGRTLNDRDSWLVLYNLNSKRSVLWSAWYQDRRDVLAFGLSVSLNEKIDFDEFITTIYKPLLAHLKNNREIMGLIIGVDVPGHFDMDSACCSDPSIRAPRLGGYSVANALMNMSYVPGNSWERFPSPLNKHHFDVDYEPQGPAVNRFTLGAGMYATTRLDGPQVYNMSPLDVNVTAKFYYDMDDPHFGRWLSIELAVRPDWTEFDSDVEYPGGIAFSWHKLRWNIVWTPGVLAYDQNSFGAVSVRSGDRFVPAALAGGYLAAIGATGEPLAGTGPDVSTIVAHLDKSLGEAVFLAMPHSLWMWELNGDPFLRIK